MLQLEHRFEDEQSKVTVPSYDNDNDNDNDNEKIFIAK